MFSRYLMLAVMGLGVASAYGQTVQAVLNAASYSTAVAPGTWVAIFGTQLAPDSVAATSVPFPTQLDGVSVTVGTLAAPLSYVSPTQINALIPFEAQVATVPLTVKTPAGSSAYLITLQAFAPGVYTKDASGTGQALVFDSSFQPVNTVGNDPIVLYATGLGPTNPAAVTGALGAAAEPLNRVQALVSVSIGGQPASILYAGLAPYMEGIYQINVTPSSAAPLSNVLSVTIPALTPGLYSTSAATLPVVSGTNVTNLSGSITALYPTSNPAERVLGYSALLTAASFSTSFDIVPGAKPFQVIAQSTEGGGVTATINIDPTQNTWQATYVVANSLTCQGDFMSYANFRVADFQNDFRLFAGNVIPQSRIDPLTTTACNSLPLPNTPTTSGVNNIWAASGTLPANGHFSTSLISGGSLSTSFGGFVNLPASVTSLGAKTATFQLYVDGVLAASAPVSFM